MNVFYQYISEIIVDANPTMYAFIIGGENGISGVNGVGYNAYGREDYWKSGSRAFPVSFAQERILM